MCEQHRTVNSILFVLYLAERGYCLAVVDCDCNGEDKTVRKNTRVHHVFKLDVSLVSVQPSAYE